MQLLTQHVLSAGGPDDDFSAERSHAHFNARVTISSELTGEQLVELGVENAVRDELQDTKEL